MLVDFDIDNANLIGVLKNHTLIVDNACWNDVAFERLKNKFYKKTGCIVHVNIFTCDAEDKF